MSSLVEPLGPRPTDTTAGRRKRAGRQAIPALLLTLPLVGTAGCAPAGEAAAASASARFQSALQRKDWSAACQLLSAEARGNLESAAALPCPRALPRLDLPTGAVRSLQVWGDNAQVHLDSAALFLAEFSAGWKVTGAGCQPRPEMPYDCDVEG